MAKAPTIITGTVGEDSHSIGSRLLSRVLRDNGYSVVELGGLTPVEEFINAARETDASAILMSSPLRDGGDRPRRVQREVRRSRNRECSPLPGRLPHGGKARLG